MGLLDWIRGLRSRGLSRDRDQQSSAPRVPKVVAGLDDEHSLYVFLIDDGGGTAIMMDKDAYDYQYGPRENPDPSQRDLDELLQRVTRVRCLAGGMVRGKPIGQEELLDVTDLREIEALHRCLAISEDASTFNHCMCLGGPTLVLSAGGDELATLGMQHGDAIRWKKWRHDAALIRSAELKQWFTRNGVDAEHLDQIYQNQHGPDLPLTAPKTAAQRKAQQMIRQAVRLCAESPSENQEQAFQLCQEALDADPDFAYAYAFRAELQKDRGLLEEAVENATKAIDLGLRIAEVYLTRAVALDLSGNQESALADCDAAIAVDPRNAGSWNSRGLIKTKSGDPAGGILDCQRAVELSGRWPVAHLNLGIAQSAAGDLDAAIQSFRQAIVQDAKFVPAYLALAQAYQQSGDFDRAIDEYTKVLEFDPTNHLARLSRGDAYLRKQDYDRGIAEYEYAAANIPELADQLRLHIVELRAHQFHERGDYRQVIEIANQHLESDEDAARFYRIRGIAHWYVGELDDAVADYTRVLMAGADELWGYSSRGQIYAELGAYEEALADLNAAVSLAREERSTEALAYSLNGLGLTFGGLGRFEEAFEAFSESLKLCPGNAWAYYNRAQVWQMAGDSSRAFQDYNRALKQDSPRLVDRLRNAAMTFIKLHAP
jgi:tetratricopeptide (TPR) repeat protein